MLVRQNRRKIVIGNWKMNPGSHKEAKKIFQDFSRKKINSTGVTVVVCPPTIYLRDIAKSYRGTKIFFGAQNVSPEQEGKATGETSFGQIKDAGARFIIIGHSERRARGESDEVIAKKVKLVLTAGMHTVLCIGEQERDSEGTHLKFLEQQLKNSLNSISKKILKNLIIAYEPIWTIGKGKEAMSPEDISMTVLFIRKILSSLYGRTVAIEIPVIYGGSANADNAYEIITKGHVDGLLAGRASLNPDEFSKIIEEVARKK